MFWTGVERRLLFFGGKNNKVTEIKALAAKGWADEGNKGRRVVVVVGVVGTAVECKVGWVEWSRVELSVV